VAQGSPVMTHTVLNVHNIFKPGPDVNIKCVHNEFTVDDADPDPLTLISMEAKI
jgi:hypothetical protein